MKKRILIIVATCLVAVSGCMTGCSKDNNSENTKNSDDSNKNEENKNGTDDNFLNEYDAFFTKFPSEIKNGEFVICANENNQEIIEGISGDPSFTFHIFSAKELNKSDVRIVMDTKNDYKVQKSESVLINEKCNENLCLLYNDLDLRIINNSRVGYKIDSEYESLTDDMFPDYYDSCFTVNFDISRKFFEEEINNIKVIIKGREYDVNIGKLEFRKNDLESYASSDVFMFDNWVKDDEYSSVGKECKFSWLKSINAKDDITIKEIRLLNTDENISLEETRFNYTSDEKIDMEPLIWEKGKDIKISGDERIDVQFIGKDENLNDKINYAADYMFEIIYEYKGEMYSTHTQTTLSTDFCSQLTYGLLKDGLDISNIVDNYKDLKDVKRDYNSTSVTIGGNIKEIKYKTPDSLDEVKIDLADNIRFKYGDDDVVKYDKEKIDIIRSIIKQAKICNEEPEIDILGAQYDFYNNDEYLCRFIKGSVTEDGDKVIKRYCRMEYDNYYFYCEISSEDWDKLDTTLENMFAS